MKPLSVEMACLLDIQNEIQGSSCYQIPRKGIHDTYQEARNHGL
jgi:hypothetical protein